MSQLSGGTAAGLGEHVVSFACGEGRDARLLGGKGVGLVKMVRLGLRVPPG